MSIITEDQVALEFLEFKKVRHEAILNHRRKLMDRMNSRHEPFPAGSFEKLSRNKIWAAVLEHLDPASLASANSCWQSFKSLSEESLLVHILSLLKMKGWLVWKARERDATYESTVSNNHNIWNLRLVSRSWKRATEQVFMNEFSDPSWYVNYPSVWPYQHPMAQAMIQKACLRRASISMELQRSSDESGAHLLCQVVLLSSEWAKETLDFLDKHNHGALIQGVHIWIGRNMETPADKYTLLVKYLTRMPNLKWLIVNNVYESPSNIEMNNDLLRERIKQFPIPTIHPLTLIQFDIEYENELIVQEILRANYAHVKSLRWPSEAPVTAQVVPQLEKLTSLTAFRVAFSGNANFSQNLTMALRQVNWPLKHLRVEGFVHLNPDTLFDLVNEFKTTLETLGLELYGYDVAHHHRLELPKLREMSVASWNLDCGLDFLLPSRSVEQLIFIDPFDDKSPSSGAIVFVGDSVEKSNVWRWFPQLVCLRIEENFGIPKCSPQHFVRKGSYVFKESIASDCEIKCKNNHSKNF